MGTFLVVQMVLMILGRGAFSPSEQVSFVFMVLDIVVGVFFLLFLILLRMTIKEDPN